MEEENQAQAELIEEEEIGNSLLSFLFPLAIVIVLTIAFLTLATNLKTGLIGGIGLLITSIFYKYPRIGIWTFLIYLPFAGTVTYSLNFIYRSVGGYVTYSPNYALLHLAKDAFYFPALIALAISTKFFAEQRRRYKSLFIAFAGLLIACLFTLFLVNLGQITEPGSSDKAFLMGIMGLKVLAGYIPLIFCAYHLLEDRKTLFWLWRVQSVIILICCVLLFIQYFLLVQGICPGNVGLEAPANDRATLQARCFVGGSLLYNPARNLLRLPGTFVAPWQWGWFLISSAFFTAAIVKSEPDKLWRILAWLNIPVVLAASIISGQRIALALVPLIFLVLLIIQQKNWKNIALQLGGFAILGIFLFTTVGIVKQQIINLINRWNYSPPTDFILNQFNWIWQNYLTLWGEGLGRATSAARRLGDIKLVEVFYAKLLYEIGIVGTIAFLVLITTIVILTFNVYLKLKTNSLRHLGLCLWLFVLFISYNPYYYPLAVDPVSVYYWFVVGILLKLPELENRQTNNYLLEDEKK